MKKQVNCITIEYKGNPMQYTLQGSTWVESFSFIDFTNQEMRNLVKSAMKRGIEVSYS